MSFQPQFTFPSSAMCTANIHQVRRRCSPNAPQLFTKCAAGVHQMHRSCSPSAPQVFTASAAGVHQVRRRCSNNQTLVPGQSPVPAVRRSNAVRRPRVVGGDVLNERVLRPGSPPVHRPRQPLCILKYTGTLEVSFYNIIAHEARGLRYRAECKILLHL
ncbi:hypothetical protein ACJJTC_013539 [Scirpophaga incertulas]